MIGAALVSSAEVCSPFQKYLFCLPLILEALCEVLINLQGLWCELPNFNPLWLWIWFLTSLFLWWKWEISCLSIYVPNQSIYFDVVNWNVFCCCTACRCYEPPSSCSEPKYWSTGQVSESYAFLSLSLSPQTHTHTPFKARHQHLTVVVFKYRVLACCLMGFLVLLLAPLHLCKGLRFFFPFYLLLLFYA